MARPSEYDKKVKPKMAEIIELISKGQPEYKIAESVGVATSTWCDYKLKYPELTEAIKKGLELQLAKVKESLIKGAVGYEFEETKETIAIGKDGKKTVKKEVTKKHYAPSATLIIFYLLNKSHGEFKDRKELVLGGTVNNPYEGLSTAELKQLIEEPEKTEEPHD